MKIVLISPFYPLRGGIAQFADLLADELENQGHELVRVNYKRQYPNFLFPGKTQFVEKIENEKSKALPLLDSIGPLSWWRLRKFLKKQNPEVLISAYWMPFMIPGLWLSTFRLKMKKVALVHNYQSHEGKEVERKLTNFYLSKQDQIVALSELVASQIKQKLSTKVGSIPHPIYAQFGEKITRKEAREILGIPPEKKVVLFFGLIRDYKGLDVLLSAFQDLNQEYFLLVAGEAYGKTEEWERAFAALGKERALWHNRFIADEEVRNYFSAANLCVLPYKSATQSGVTAVAHNFHLPVIATDVGGLKEFIHSNKNGDLVPANNSQILSDKIEEYFSKNKEEKYREVLQNEAGLSWQEFTLRFVRFLQDT